MRFTTLARSAWTTTRKAIACEFCRVGMVSFASRIFNVHSSQLFSSFLIINKQLPLELLLITQKTFPPLPLPAYHTKCIDVWLTKNRRVCPVCKRKVYTIGERRRNRRRQSADSTTDSMSSFDPDDTTPLINPQDSSANHGTFNGRQDGDDEPLEEGTAPNIASDDEMLDGQQRSAFQRFNPFDRVPNLPPQLVEELGAGVIIEEPESRWGRFKR